MTTYYTPEELADALQVTTGTIYRWHSAGKGPPRIEIGRKHLYRFDAVEKWLLSRETGEFINQGLCPHCAGTGAREA